MIVQAVESRPQPSVSLMPGTVASVGATVDVVMDGDADGVVVQAAPLFADLSVADRVMVLFDPPRGVFVVGTIGRAHEAGTLVVWSDVPVTDLLTIDDDVVSVSSERATLHAGRRYRLEVSVYAGYLSGGNDVEQWVAVSASVQFFPGSDLSNLLLTASGYVHGQTFAGSIFQGTVVYLLEPTLTYATDFAYDVAVSGGEATLGSYLSVTDVGPA